MNRIKKSIGILIPAIRISFALVLLTTCVLLGAELFGFTPDESKYELDSRKKISESLAIQFSLLASKQDINTIHKLIRYIVKRNPDIESAGIRLATGKLIFQSANHSNLWQGYNEEKSTSTHVLVPIMREGDLWANVELKFADIHGTSFWNFLDQNIFKMSAFVLLIGFFVFLIFMLRTLRQLDPTTVIPDRVNAAFDTLSEGLIILDDEEQIVLANKSFCDKIGRPIESLLGIKASELKWKRISKEKSGVVYPWIEVLSSGKHSLGSQLILISSKNEAFKFVLNASPISSHENDSKGVLITLDDITELEERNTKLQTMVEQLEETHEQVKQQNKELHYLATRDPMTGCLNRRAFYELFDETFNVSKEQNLTLSCFMADLDHFKSVNDNYGHAVGDEVIKMLAEVLHANTRKIDLVGRYGGEEFCVVLPGLSAQEAFSVAERIRLRVKDESTKRFSGGPRVTASIGIASLSNAISSPSDLNNLADEALYIAKEMGRNRVMIWTPDSKSSLSKTAEETEKTVNTETQEQKNVESLQNRIDQLETIASQFSEELEYNKSYDALTGLPNQILFYDRVSQAIERGYRHDQLAAVLIFDIAMFSQINSTFGRETGDKLLKVIANLLESIFRKSDNVSRLTVSRMAGDEFAVLLTDLNEKDQATWVVKRLLDEIKQPISIDENDIYLSCNVGISLYPTDAQTVDDLLNHAMSAKKFCKKANAEISYQFFDHHIQELSIQHIQLDTDIRDAIKEEQWELLYQPKWDMKRNKVLGVEALIRWNHPKRGLLSPHEFIDFAEQRGLIIPIGNWVINEACKQLKTWADMGIHDCKIAVNLSSIQLMQKDIARMILNALDTHQVPPRQFELEITETVLMDNLSTAMKALKKLNSRGINIAIDDFGTGYSSLGYLKNLPINSLKIDRSFIHDVDHDENDKSIVQTLITMAHSMNLSVVAEGVEEKSQYDILDQLGCDEIQGYILSKPVTAKELVEMISEPVNLTESV